MEQSTLVKQHVKACDLAGIERLPFYTFRHTSVLSVINIDNTANR